MSLRIQNNTAAFNAHKNLGISDSNMSKSLERLSSGFRINKAADDAAGLSISQQMGADIASFKSASQNASQANSMLQVAEGAMDQIGNMLTRLKELATQAASGNSSSNLDKIESEGNKLIAEIDRISSNTAYAGVNLVDGSFGVGVSAGSTNWDSTHGYAGQTGVQQNATYSVAVVTNGANLNITVSATIGGVRKSETLYGVSEAAAGVTKDIKLAELGLTLTVNSNFTSTNANATVLVGASTGNSDFQVGAKNTTNDRIGVSIGSVSATGTGGLGLSASGNMDTAAHAQTFMSTLDTAISTLNTRRGDIGAAQNRLGYASANLATTIENVTAAKSVIKDTDMAEEMTNFTKNQILMQAGTAMLAQANSQPQQLLSLFKG